MFSVAMNFGSDNKPKPPGKIRRALSAMLGELRETPSGSSKGFGRSLILPFAEQFSTETGISVTPEKALELPAYHNAVWSIASTLAYLPINIYKKNNDGTREQKDDHPLYEVLHNEPNPEMSAFDFFIAMQINLCLTGNGYAQIIRDGNGRVIQLWPFLPGNIRTEPDGARTKYFLKVQGGDWKEIPRNQIFHIRGMTVDGVHGLSPVQLHRNAIALALAAEYFGAKFFKSGAAPSFAIEYPDSVKMLSDPAKEHLSETFRDTLCGLGNTARIPILFNGGTIKQLSMSPENSQFDNTRKTQTTEMARSQNIQPHKISDLERATFSNIEHQGIEFVVSTMGPITKNWETNIRRQLLTPQEKAENYYIKFNMNALLRGDTTARHAAYANGRQWGYLNADDIRAMEDMDPLPDGKGQTFLQPSNMIPAGTDPQKDNSSTGGRMFDLEIDAIGNANGKNRVKTEVNHE